MVYKAGETPALHAGETPALHAGGTPALHADRTPALQVGRDASATIAFFAASIMHVISLYLPGAKGGAG